ncbi:hypothetical protein PMIN02_003092 [Paraphaeosphaeria minitans]|uniref:Uncharacterized protein n=1 Tax=Paraphaeosphaeria minitans TaxID=565426 RepID=A0A9P6GRT2_9PLEO|nr:hypothetical protein PMIN01_01703 [Paraphaeosphaeria minitans]
MAPAQPYYGPIGMADSRYASPQRRKQVEALLAADPELQARKTAENILALREQAADNHFLVQCAGAQLEQDVTQHMHAVDQTVSTVVAKAHQIVNLISDAIKHERPDTAALKVVENLRQEVNKLVETTRQMQGALPYFLEKQKEDSDLVAGAKYYQAHQDIQLELDQKEKKIKLDQELVNGQQHALKDVEVDSSVENAEQQEHISRLQMDLGLVRSEMETQKDELKKAKAAEEDAAKMREVLEEKLETLIVSKRTLSAENENIKGLEAKLKAAEDKVKEAAEDYENQLQKEQQKVASTLRQADEAYRREFDKVKAELKLQSDKYNNQSTAYAKMAENLKEQKKKMTALDDKVSALQQQKADLEKQHNRVTFLKDSLQTQHGVIKSELEELKQELGLAKDEAHQLSSKLKRAESGNDELERENKDLRVKQSEHNKTISALRKGDAEIDIATLRATVQSLKNKPTATSDSANSAALRKELQTLNERLTQSEAEGAKWEDLGRQAMLRYREILLEHRQLEGVEKQLNQVLVENQELKAKCASTSGSNDEVKYWRDKYNDLLVEMEK